MIESDDTQRFDALLEAMATKPPLDVNPKEELPEDDLREGDSD